MLKKYPELADAAQKCKVDLTFTDFRDMEQRIEFIKRYVKQSKSPTVDELVDILETIKVIKERF
nr:hypothetical protein MACL_00001310 [Theileria orientalis]